MVAIGYQYNIRFIVSRTTESFIYLTALGLSLGVGFYLYSEDQLGSNPDR